MAYYSIVLRSKPDVFTYESSDDISEGSLVQVPFRNRSLSGVVHGRSAHKPSFETKEITKVIQESVLNSFQLALINRISEYFFCTKSQATQLFLPSFLWGAHTPKREEFLSRVDFAYEPSPRSRKQIALLEALREEEIEIQDAKKTFSLRVVNDLLNKKVIQKRSGSLLPGFSLPMAKPIEKKEFTSEQQHVFDAIQSSSSKRFLIHGVTGSGKTEIYLRLAQDMISQGKGVVLLVPEISLTTQLIQYFVDALGEKIAVWHSNMTDNERSQEWWRLQHGEAQLVLGSRSALFAPVADLGLVIIDEEHEWTYKQDNAPRYHARTVAEMMCDLQDDVKVVLGSATPDVGTYMQALSGEGYELLTLSERFGEAVLPEVEIVDLREEFMKKNFSPFSDSLMEALTETLEKGEQAILFLNKRGSASAILCRECGYICRCSACDIAMTLHETKETSRLVCHHCGLLSPPPNVCPSCKSSAIKQVGIGTQRVESELKKLFPDTKVLRADRDTTGTKKGFENMYHDFLDRKADILVGTQMIAKGLDLPDVGLVGVVLADVGLHIPDFRSSERTFQLLTQVAGRAGRREKRGKVIIQTYCPDHLAIRAAARHDYLRFYEKEIAERRTFGYPPFQSIVKLTYTHEDKGVCFRQAKSLYEELVKMKDDAREGDVHFAPASLPRLHGKYRWHVYLQGEGWHDILRGTTLFEGWKIDRDPMMMG